MTPKGTTERCPGCGSDIKGYFIHPRCNSGKHNAWHDPASLSAPSAPKLSRELSATPNERIRHEKSGTLPDDSQGETLMPATSSDPVRELVEALRECRATNQELNRRVQSLEHSLAKESGKGSWHGYWRAAAQLYSEEYDKRVEAERVLARYQK